jgi:mRNA-degrading endonuclease toxin of MazEF toxin-antitoxin module
MMDSGIRLPSGRLCLSTVVFIGEERGMDFAVPLQPHEETVVILFRLINPADARRA